jgi:hypothetical protein
MNIQGKRLIDSDLLSNYAAKSKDNAERNKLLVSKRCV